MAISPEKLELMKKVQAERAKEEAEKADWIAELVFDLEQELEGKEGRLGIDFAVVAPEKTGAVVAFKRNPMAWEHFKNSKMTTADQDTFLQSCLIAGAQKLGVISDRDLLATALDEFPAITSDLLAHAANLVGAGLKVQKKG